MPCFSRNARPLTSRAPAPCSSICLRHKAKKIFLRALVRVSLADSAHELRARCAASAPMLDNRPPFLRMPPVSPANGRPTTATPVRCVGATYGFRDARATRSLNSPDSKTFGGRRLEGSTVDDLGRGLDVPPAFDSAGLTDAAVLAAPAPPGVWSRPGIRDLPAGGGGGLQSVVRSARQRGDERWHDASSDVDRTRGGRGSISPTPWNCSAPCPA